MTRKGSNGWCRSRLGVLLGASFTIMMLGTACSPLDDDDEEPTATAGASIQGPDTSASPPPSPVAGGLQGTPAATQGSSSTPDAGPAGGTPASAATPAGDATPVTDAPPEATPGEDAQATPEEAGEAEDGASVVDSCEPEEIPAFEGDDPNFVVTASLNFRQGPGQDCDPIGEGPLAEGSNVVVLSEPVTREGEDQQWVQIEVDGEPGWVAAEFIEPAE